MVGTYKEQTSDETDGDAERDGSRELDSRIAAFLSHGCDHAQGRKSVSVSQELL